MIGEYTLKYRSYGVNNFRESVQFQKYLDEDQKRAIEVVGKVLPFKINSYVIEELINWQNVPNDPIFRLTVPHKDMLKAEAYEKLDYLLAKDPLGKDTPSLIEKLRLDLNPHPANQMTDNIPYFEGEKLQGIQHKYKETLLFFPSHGQTCHSYCSFCFRWPQFVGIDDLKFATNETQVLVNYLKANPCITDVLITGGDPLIMNARRLREYIIPLLSIESVRCIRLGTKSLSFWPYRFLTDKDAGELLELFSTIVASGKHLAFMAHFSHPAELNGGAVKQALRQIQATGAKIRTQSPLIRHVNDNAEVWRDMWQEQVNLGCIPYYFFLARDTGAQHYFALPLADAFEIFTNAYSSVSGICRSVKGPVMSCTQGKVQIIGITVINDKKVFVLQFIQARNPAWVNKPFFAAFDPAAIWFDELRPAFENDNQFFK